MRAIVTVMGIDKKGIIAKVSSCLSENNINILDINQTIMQDLFTMVMLVDVSEAENKFAVISDKLSAIGEELGVEVKIQHEEIFRSMHRI
ncbi:MAG: ACT domain-containing protein [Clostridia bacterium]|nr:ACT domain-containing protein [Clostridia bacterium]